MARLYRKEPLIPQKGNRDSGRTISRLLARSKSTSSESRPLRCKNQLKPTGKARFPFSKYRPAGTKINAFGEWVKEDK